MSNEIDEYKVRSALGRAALKYAFILNGRSLSFEDTMKASERLEQAALNYAEVVNANGTIKV